MFQRPRFHACLWLAVLLSCPTFVWAEIRPEFLMDHDPELTVRPSVLAFAPRLGTIWQEALLRPEFDMQRLAADAIARGQRAGLPDLKSSIPRLRSLLTATDSDPLVRLAAARALIALQDRDAARDLAEAARKFGLDLRRIVEPALAEWHYEPYTADWEARLASPNYRPREVLLAVPCLAKIGRTAAADRLLAIMHEPRQRADLRLEAARAVAILRESGLEAHAWRLLDAPGSPLVQRVCAVELLARHSGDATQRVLLKLAADEEPAVAAAALGRLIEIDPNLVMPLAERALHSPDVHLRERGAQAYLLIPNAQRVTALTELLDDPDPRFRRSVCASLLDLARRPELDAPIRDGAVKVLGGQRWRGQEQAALLLGSLDHEPCAPRLQELLDSPRTEVEIAAAWALKSLAIAETLPVLLEWTRQRTAARRQHEPLPAGIDDEVAHLFELFGKTKYAVAEPLLREHVPKQFDVGMLSRAAAIWSLGQLHAGVPDEKLGIQLIARARDMGGILDPPEMYKVRQMSLVTIGLMKAVSRTTDVQAMLTPEMPSSLDSEICRWVVMQLTEKPHPELKPNRVKVAGWFLEPLEE